MCEEKRERGERRVCVCVMRGREWCVVVLCESVWRERGSVCVCVLCVCVRERECVWCVCVGVCVSECV